MNSQFRTWAWKFLPANLLMPVLWLLPPRASRFKQRLSSDDPAGQSFSVPASIPQIAPPCVSSSYLPPYACLRHYRRTSV